MKVNVTEIKSKTSHSFHYRHSCCRDFGISRLCLGLWRRSSFRLRLWIRRTVLFNEASDDCFDVLWISIAVCELQLLDARRSFVLIPNANLPLPLEALIGALERFLKKQMTPSCIVLSAILYLHLIDAESVKV